MTRMGSEPSAAFVVQGGRPAKEIVRRNAVNKIQSKSNEKVQRKRKTRAIAFPQLAASKISHKQTDYSGTGWVPGRRVRVKGRS